MDTLCGNCKLNINYKIKELITTASLCLLIFYIKTCIGNGVSIAHFYKGDRMGTCGQIVQIKSRKSHTRSSCSLYCMKHAKCKGFLFNKNNSFADRCQLITPADQQTRITHDGQFEAFFTTEKGCICLC